MKKYGNILIAVTGVLIGALAVIAFDAVKENRLRIKTEYSDWRKLNLILRALDDNYVDTIDRKKVTDAAITAALSELDPHSVYMQPQELSDAEEDLGSNFEGIGIQFNVPNDTVVVLEVIPGGPSEKAGLMKGDRILKVDDRVIAGVKFPQDSMVRLMKGPSGTKVKISVVRDRDKISFDITRGRIPIHSVDASFMLNDTTGYIRFSKFSKTTGYEILKAGNELKEAGMTSLVFDIRDNTGGYFDQALLTSNLFLKKGDGIVFLKGAHREKENYYADGSGPFQDIKLSVLINEGSASSSEIFAGAMQDNGRAVIIGRRSFGKGLVQEPLYFSDGSGIRLTVARFYSPSGRCLQKPYTKDYAYELERRMERGEYEVADSMKKENGGIIPDVFIPMDTTKAGKFYVECVRKATTMRFSSAFFDSHKKALSSIDNYDGLLAYLDSQDLERKFLAFASSVDGIRPEAGEWKLNRDYIMTQVRALVGRYSKLGDNAYYHLYIPMDRAVQRAIEQ